MTKIEVGNGIHLSGVRATDKAALLEHLNDDGEISSRMIVIPYPYKESDADWWIGQRVEATKRLGTEATFAIRDPAEKLIGVVGSDSAKIGESHRAELGYWLAKPYRGKGIASASLRAFVRHAFENLRVTRLQARALDINLASARVLEKNGFVLEGRLRKDERTRDGLYDVLIFGLLKEEFKG